MPAQPHSRAPRPLSLSRLLLRIVFWLLFALCVPVLLWWVFNRIDEAPSAAALRYGAPSPVRVSDADNAWLHLVGNGAAEAIDPVVQGRRQVDVSSARLSRSPVPPADAAELALFEPALALVLPDPQRDGTAQLCPSRQRDCLDWAGQHEAMLQRLRTANAVRLQRFRELLRLPGWQALYVPSSDLPLPRYWIATLHLNLLALEVRDALAAPSDHTTSALAPLAEWVEFWQALRSQPQDAVSMLVAARYIEDAQRIASSWMDRHAGDPSDADRASLERILQVPAAPLDWSEAMRHEFKVFDAMLRDAVPSPWAALGQCMTGSSSDGCLSGLASSSAYAHQATLNLHAFHRSQIQRLLEADPAQIDAVVRSTGAAMQTTFPALDDHWLLLRQLAYNYTGRVLAVLALPEFDWHLRGHDQEALRRMLTIKRHALQSGIDTSGKSPSAMGRFLEQQPADLRNPYDGTAFDWDPLFREVRFQPRAHRHWQRTHLGFAIGAAPPAGLDPCQQLVLLRLAVVDPGTEPEQGHAGEVVRLSSCGLGNEPRWHGHERIADPEDPVFQTFRKYQALDVRLHDGQIGVRVAVVHAGELLSFEAVMQVADGEQQLTLAPLGSDAAARLRVQLSTGSFDEHDPGFDLVGDPVAINTDDAEPAALAARIAATKSLQLQGVERLTRQRISLHGDFSVEQALTALAQASDLQLVRRSAVLYRFEPR